MKALVLNGYGGNEQLSIEDRPKPTPSANQVLIRVTHAGLNPLDYKIRAGKLKLIRHLTFPHIMGNEVAGIIESVGNSQAPFQVGDHVYARLDKAKMGAFAEYVAEDKGNVALAPKNVAPEVAAGIPLVALTAWQSLFDVGHLQAGQEVLIHGGAGSVGRFAVQFAKQARAKVTVTGSEPSRHLLHELGADDFVDYRTGRFEDAGRKFDLVFDLVGGDTLDRSFAVIKPGGMVVSVAGLPEPQTARDIGLNWFIRLLFGLLSRKQLALAKKAQATYRYVFMVPDGKKLQEFARWIEEGKLKVAIDRVFSLEQFAEAFSFQESGKAKGKIVFKI